jgi:hypothetical protein
MEKVISILIVLMALYLQGCVLFTNGHKSSGFSNSSIIDEPIIIKSDYKIETQNDKSINSDSAYLKIIVYDKLYDRPIDNALIEIFTLKDTIAEFTSIDGEYELKLPKGIYNLKIFYGNSMDVNNIISIGETKIIIKCNLGAALIH